MTGALYAHLCFHNVIFVTPLLGNVPQTCIRLLSLFPFVVLLLLVIQQVSPFAEDSDLLWKLAKGVLCWQV